MPGIVKGSGHSVKRKRGPSETKPIKRAKSESSDDGENLQAELAQLETEIVESKKYDKIPALIKILQGDSETASIAAAFSLCKIFAKLMASGDLSNKPGETEEKLKKLYSTYKTHLLVLLGNQDDGPSTPLELCMVLVKSEGRTLRQAQDHSFPADFLTDIVRVLLQSGGGARKEFTEHFVEEYDDIRFYTLKSMENILGEPQSLSSEGSVFDNALEILSPIEPPETKEDLEDFFTPAPKKSKHDLYSITKHKTRAQGAWLALMRLEMDREQRKALLSIMADTIAPWFMKPELLMDFLTDSYNAGGSTSLLALSGVFYLIQEKNLDYPLFYPKLYSLIDSDILHSKHRSRFFRLLDTFLASTHLPAALVASFLKRLSRLTLNAPPSAIVAVVPWIYNILKKHPSCTFMIHRETRDPKAKEVMDKEGFEDPFLMDEEDPMETDAIESSLWEIVALQSHFHPNVATLANIISEQFTKTSYNLEDFLDHSYGSMLEAEMMKDAKKMPAIEFEIPKTIFTGGDSALRSKVFKFT